MLTEHTAGWRVWSERSYALRSRVTVALADTDAHAKNPSLAHAGPHTVALAPLYDGVRDVVRRQPLPRGPGRPAPGVSAEKLLRLRAEGVDHSDFVEHPAVLEVLGEQPGTTGHLRGRRHE